MGPGNRTVAIATLVSFLCAPTLARAEFCPAGRVERSTTVQASGGAVDVRWCVALVGSTEVVDGPYESRHANGARFAKGSFSNGVPTETWTFREADGRNREGFLDAKGRMTGQWVTTAPDGRVIDFVQYLTIRDRIGGAFVGGIGVLAGALVGSVAVIGGGGASMTTGFGLLTAALATGGVLGALVVVVGSASVLFVAIRGVSRGPYGSWPSIGSNLSRLTDTRELPHNPAAKGGGAGTRR